jgi:tartronate-semialdehyde synthase
MASIRRGGRRARLQGAARVQAGEIAPALKQAQALDEFSVPVIVEVILERVTNISMGAEIDAINEFEDLAEKAEHAPTAISMLD